MDPAQCIHATTYRRNLQSACNVQIPLQQFDKLHTTILPPHKGTCKQNSLPFYLNYIAHKWHSLTIVDAINQIHYSSAFF